MENILFQFGTGGDMFSWVIWIAVMVVLFFFYPRMMISQIMWKLERSAQELESLSRKSKRIVLKEIGGSDKRTRESVNRFFEFFVIGPVSMDPYGIVGKVEFVIKNQKNRFEHFVDQVAPKADAEKKAALEMGLAGGMTVHEIAKIVRHYVETIRKTKSIQIAMILQMQMPMVERIARAMYKGTQTMIKAEPIGDGLGPLVAAELIGNNRVRDAGEEIVVAETSMMGRKLFVMKAGGPGGRIGMPGQVVDRFVRKKKIDMIVTVDAAAKLEGEKTGSLAEGVGVAMGGPGTDRYRIEEVAVKGGIPLDSIIVKMSQEEAIMPMRKAVKDAIPHVLESLGRSLERTKRGSRVLVFGVGNSSGVGNSKKAADKVRKWVDANEKKLLADKKAKKSEFAELYED
jgi:hypothetical protein